MHAPATPPRRSPGQPSKLQIETQSLIELHGPVGIARRALLGFEGRAAAAENVRMGGNSGGLETGIQRSPKSAQVLRSLLATPSKKATTSLVRQTVRLRLRSFERHPLARSVALTSARKRSIDSNPLPSPRSGGQNFT
jgi:hypothetical protein